MIIIENKHEKEKFLQKWNNEISIIIPIWEDLERHPINNSLSFLYIYMGGEDYIISFNHNDCQSINIDLSESRMIKWVWNKKGFLQMDIQIQELKDIQTHLFFERNQLYDFQSKLELLTNFYYRLGIRDDLGKSLPIMKWGEVLKGIVEEWSILPIIENSGKSEWVDETMIPILSEMERNGIHIDTQKFLDRWPKNTKHLKGDFLYTEYNPYTITSRPSNRHGGINFSALNKNDGTREVFVPRNNHMFLQMDYDAYHPRIIGKLIGYELPKTSVHQWLADQYGVPYDDGKGVTFQLLYGGIPDEFLEIPFYKKVKEYIDELWEKVKVKGYLQTHKRKIPLSQIEDVNPQKVFNYLLQATETELNMIVLKKLKDDRLPLPILYVYDSFLFEYSLDANSEIAKRIKDVLESFGFPVKVSWGSDYSKV